MFRGNAEYALMCAGEVVLMGAVRGGGHELPHNHFGIIFYVVVSHIVLYSSLFGEDFQFDKCFSDGFKPPTSFV